jgi:hypothetical protein
MGPHGGERIQVPLCQPSSLLPLLRYWLFVSFRQSPWRSPPKDTSRRPLLLPWPPLLAGSPPASPWAELRPNPAAICRRPGWPWRPWGRGPASCPCPPPPPLRPLATWRRCRLVPARKLLFSLHRVPSAGWPGVRGRAEGPSLLKLIFFCVVVHGLDVECGKKYLSW